MGCPPQPQINRCFLALAGNGSFVTMAPPSARTRPDLAVIETFLSVEIAVDERGEGNRHMSVGR